MHHPTLSLHACRLFKKVRLDKARFYFKLYFLLSASLVTAVLLQAQWSNSEPISLSSGLHPNIVSDGAGGQIVANYTAASINMVKLNSAGVGQWTAAIIPIVYGQLVPVAMTTDGAGGVIVAWTAYDNDYNIYAQRIDANGETRWSSPRTAVCTGEGDQLKASIVSDGQGGAIICWYDHRNGKGVYAQRLNAAGVAQWATDGVLVTPSTEDPENDDDYGPAMVSNGAGEVSIAWTQDVSGRSDIFAQRLNGSGTRQWPVAGVKLTTSAGTYPFLLNDGSGGNIIVWKGNSVRAQRINTAGIIQWTAGGKTVSTANGRPFATSDESGGAFITWISSGVRAQRINDQGSNQWTQDALLCISTYQPAMPLVITDGAGGCIVSWFDLRSSVNYQVFAQRINGSGTLIWPTNGASLYPQLMTQLNPVISSNGAQGAVVAWNNSPGPGGATYAQNINSNGTPGPLQAAPPCHWTGAMNSAWENPANWSGGTIPGSGSDVIINGGTVVINSNATIRTLTVMPASTLAVSPGHTLKVLH
ncbi:MAG: hypothetical protein ACHQFX_03860 [Chitinophagales bacterium]